MLNFKIVLLLLIASLTGFNNLNAEDGQPIAIRHWPGGGVTFETMWGLSVGVGLDPDSEIAKSVDLVDAALGDRQGGVLGREPNSDKVVFNAEGKSDENGVAVRRALFSLVGQGAPQALPWIVVEADGVKACVLKAKPSKSELALLVIANSRGQYEKPDVVIAVGQQFDNESSAQLMKIFEPKVMVVNAAFEELNGIKVTSVEHNTLACSSKFGKDVKLFSLGTTPYEMSDEVADLFAKKEAAQKDSREMFAKLSVEQMNFKPANGSHTPRWNTEHMMGRELGFFSEIYHAVDPSIPVMNLNPKQMPKDYEFAHADWTGEEEARQMKRVEDFTRRFAYLLDGMDLDKKAKGSRFWTPRRLLMQMERHYKEHSANVVKKMKLEGWPAK